MNAAEPVLSPDPSMGELPLGTITFLFADIEGSTALARKLSTDQWQDVLARHAPLIRAVAERYGGVEVSTTGESFFFAFRQAYDAVAAAADAQRALAATKWPHDVRVRVRIGLHTGERVQRARPEAGADYVGYDVHRAARIADAGHGGQVLLSSVTVGLLGDNLPAGVAFRDVGEYRLKGLSHPERLYQLVIEGVPDRFPPPRAASARRHELPMQLTSFVGRERELAAAAALLGQMRLLTFVGPAGTGKTRLAIEVASRAADDYEDGVQFVPLAPIKDPRLILPTIARSVGAHEGTRRSLAESVAASLRDAHLLLLLDNFEQVLEAAGVVAELLARSSWLKVIVTSRAALSISAEREFPVEPLPVPDPGRPTTPEHLAAYDSVRLFVERARAIRPDFALTVRNAHAVGAICARLEGLPLAIELAAVRTRVLPVEELAARLDHRLAILAGGPRDQPQRQRTLREAIAWSYDLLEESERRLFRRIATFAGGFTLEAAQAVCGGALSSLLEGLDSLVRQSLTRQVEGADGRARFAMLQVIREYAEEQLHATDEADRIHAAHAEHYLHLAESAQLGFDGPEMVSAMRTLEQERENLRAALTWYIEHGDFDRAARLAGSLGPFWWVRGQVSEGRSWIERVLALPDAAVRTPARQRILSAAGMIAFQQKDVAAGRPWLEEAIAIGRELGDAGAVAEALHWLGDITLIERGPEETAALYREGVELARASGRQGPLAAIQTHIAFNALLTGDLGRTRSLVDELLVLVRRFGNPWTTAAALLADASLDLAQDAAVRAEPKLREALSLLRELGDRFMLLAILVALGSAAAARGDPERGLRLLGAADAEAERSGSILPEPLYRLLRNPLDQAKAALDTSAAERAYAAGRAMSIESALEYALEEREVVAEGG